MQVQTFRAMSSDRLTILYGEPVNPLSAGVFGPDLSTSLDVIESVRLVECFIEYGRHGWYLSCAWLVTSESGSDNAFVSIATINHETARRLRDSILNLYHSPAGFPGTVVHCQDGAIVNVSI